MAITQLGYHETLVNNFQDAINPAINASDTTMTVSDASKLPTSGFFRCQIDSEIILFNGRTGNVLNVASSGRGYENTTAAIHSINAPIKAVFTAGGFQRFMLDHRGVAFTENATVRSTPYNRFLDENNGVLTVSSFTWQNQGGATATDLNGAVYMTVPDEANPNLRLLTYPIPSTPYRVLAKLNLGVGMGNLDNTGTQAGLFFRESSTGKLVVAVARYGGRLGFLRFTNPTTFSDVIDTLQQFHEDEIWLRLDDDGVDLSMRASNQGVGFSTTANAAWWQDPRTSFMAGGPDEIGIYINSGTNSGNTGAGPAVAHATFEAFRVEEL